MFKALCSMLMVSVIVLSARLPAPNQTLAQNDEWQVTAVVPIEFRTNPAFLLMAPDGRHFAYQAGGTTAERALCREDSVTGSRVCLDLPEDFPRNLGAGTAFPSMAWAPDSARLAVVGVPWQLMMDTDLSVVDFASGAITALADEGYSGRIFPVPAGVMIDTAPSWSPDGAQIAVERTMSAEDGRFSQTMLTVIDAATGKATPLVAPPGHAEHDTNVGVTLFTSWSPDGATLAMSIRHQPVDRAFDGIWLAGVTSGELAHLASMDAVEEAQRTIPAGMPDPVISSLAWSPAGTHLLFWAGDPGTSVWGFWLSVPAGEITPIPLPRAAGEPAGRRLNAPIQAAWSADGGALLVAVREEMPYANEPLTLLDPDQERHEVSLRIVDIASGEITLLGHLAYAPVMAQSVPWAASGDTLVTGYHLGVARK